MLLAVSPSRTTAPRWPIGWHWLLLGMCLPLAGLGALAMRLKGSWSAVLLAFAAGLAFTCVAVSARSLDLPDPAWRILLEPTTWAIVVNGILGTVLFALALQRGKVTVVAAVSFTTEHRAAGRSSASCSWVTRCAPATPLVATAGFLIAVSGAIALAQFSGPLPARHRANRRTRASLRSHTERTPARGGSWSSGWTSPHL